MEDVFKKANKVYQLLENELKIDKDEVNRIVSKLVNGFHNRSRDKTVLSKKEASVYELLLSKKYNPNTVYRWLLVVNSPEEIKTKLKSGELSIREALEKRNKIRKQFTTNDEDIIKEIIWHVEEYIL